MAWSDKARAAAAAARKGKKGATKKGVSQAAVNITKGNHKPGWMLRADPALAKKIKRIRAARQH